MRSSVQDVNIVPVLCTYSRFHDIKLQEIWGFQLQHMINQHNCCTLLFYGFSLHRVALKPLHVCNILKSTKAWCWRSKTSISTTGLVTLILHIPIWNCFAHVEILSISECTVSDAGYLWWFSYGIQLITMDNSPAKTGLLCISVYLQLTQPHRWSGEASHGVTNHHQVPVPATFEQIKATLSCVNISKPHIYVCKYVCPFTYWSTHVYIHTCPSIYLSIHLYAYPSIHSSIQLCLKIMAPFWEHKHDHVQY